MSTTVKLAQAIALGLMLMPMLLRAQDRPTQWQRRSEPTAIPVTVFHSPQSANLPTAETLGAGELQFEISHRFVPPLSSGADDLWGLDGPVVNRLGLAFGIVDRAMITLQRSNLDDNLDLNLKVRAYETRAEEFSLMTAVFAGMAWNTDVPERPALDSRNFQYYGALVLNALAGKRWAFGLAPAYLWNPRIDAEEAEHALSLGLYGQVYLTSGFSLLGEWNVSEAREDLEYDAGSFGFELETGGHFFKLLLTNSARMNPAQFLAGTPYRFEPKEWRIGFNITRVLRF